MVSLCEIIRQSQLIWLALLFKLLQSMLQTFTAAKSQSWAERGLIHFLPSEARRMLLEEISHLPGRGESSWLLLHVSTSTQILWLCYLLDHLLRLATHPPYLFK